MIYMEFLKGICLIVVVAMYVYNTCVYYFIYFKQYETCKYEVWFKFICFY